MTTTYQIINKRCSQTYKIRKELKFTCLHKKTHTISLSLRKMKFHSMHPNTSAIEKKNRKTSTPK